MTVFLETPRLLLRNFTEEDANNLYELDSDPEVIRFVNLGIIKGVTAIDIDYETIKNKTLPKWLRYYQEYENYGIWAAIEKTSSEFIGWFHFRPASDNLFYFNLGFYDASEIELGYRLKKAKWHQGYATEGSLALVHKGFLNGNTQRVVSMALANHMASIRVMEKVGLNFVAKYFHPEIEREVVKYALNRNEFNANTSLF
ncbi:GNAT family N-acetyltransferase [Chroogloeocystis siderophila]|jgi:ribosomal-protein-alanine N-acetyltransferase|uniref:GNAT family N-acetyltransferase n=1 Tax=Chroogloeocystis siderophila 5.2 s.c.1 TaxID=247279 RepID=A0A1U7HZ20_9CHRO|nr:GNAT family N-acetyltransferase [Chroogloeocystis siderophila]OKH28895.1 GNAT family N-acetyltransferase [Chroogloeocystis siderophila 5.2 s.c.1]